MVWEGIGEEIVGEETGGERNLWETVREENDERGILNLMST